MTILEQSLSQPVKITYLTEKGLNKLKAELDYLRTVKRREIMEQLQDFNGESDLSEDNEYLLIKDEQAIVEGRIVELENLLLRVEIIQPGSSRGTIRLGSTVTLQDLEGQIETYTIVGSTEANVREGLISDESPMGKALLGHVVGDDVEVKAPDGLLKFRIVSVT
jgi:transcription elongation factor GreA